MNSSGEKEKLEQYFTPEWAAKLCMELFLKRVQTPNLVVDAFAGGGAFFRHLPSTIDRWQSDIDPEFGHIVRDAFDVDVYGSHVVTNPAFSRALDYIDYCLGRAKSIDLLLPLSFLGSSKRYELMKKNPPQVTVINPRVSYLYRQPDGTIKPLRWVQKKGQTDLVPVKSTANGDSALFSWGLGCNPGTFSVVNVSKEKINARL